MKDRLSLITCVLLAAALTGCSGGGGGGGLSLSGGSVPTGGGGTIQGLAVLPNSQPLTDATVSVRSLATGQAVTGTPTLTASGAFTITGVPTSEDLEVVLQRTNGPMLKAVVSQSQLSGASSQPVNIGAVNALTTVVAQCLEQEASQNPDQTPQIVTDQLGPLTTSLEGEHQGTDDQNQEIQDSGKLTAAAQALILNTTNAELQALAVTPTAATAAAALHGLTGEIAAAGAGQVHLSAAQRSALTSAQLAGTTYSAATLAAALAAAGTSAAADGVTAADAAQRTQLPGWSALGTGIGPFEALAIATSSVQSGGFALSPSATNQFLTALLGTAAGGSGSGGDDHSRRSVSWV